MLSILLIFRYCHPTNHRKPQPSRVHPCPTPQSLPLPAAALPSRFSHWPPAGPQPSYRLILTHSSPIYTSISPNFDPGSRAKYHRPRPQQSAGHSPISRTPPLHQSAGHTGPPLSCHPSRSGRKHQ